MLKAESFDGGLQTFRVKIDAGLHFNRYNIPIVLRKKIKFVRRIGIRPIAGDNARILAHFRIPALT